MDIKTTYLRKNISAIVLIWCLVFALEREITIRLIGQTHLSCLRQKTNLLNQILNKKSTHVKTQTSNCLCASTNAMWL